MNKELELSRALSKRVIDEISDKLKQKIKEIENEKIQNLF